MLLSFGNMTMELNIFNISKQPQNSDNGIDDVDLIKELIDHSLPSNLSNDPSNSFWFKFWYWQIN